MSIGGTFNVSRGIWTDPQFPNEPFTKREAWLWLVSEASWKPRTVRVGSKVVDLERGQVAASVRFMAGAWQWEPTKVLRFLRALEGAQNIATDSATGVKRITICNYELYQSDHGQGATENATPAQQPRNSTATNEKKGESKGINTPLNPPRGKALRALRPGGQSIRSKGRRAFPNSSGRISSPFVASIVPRSPRPHGPVSNARPTKRGYRSPGPLRCAVNAAGAASGPTGSRPKTCGPALAQVPRRLNRPSPSTAAPTPPRASSASSSRR